MFQKSFRSLFFALEFLNKKKNVEVILFSHRTMSYIMTFRNVCFLLSPISYKIRFFWNYHFLSSSKVVNYYPFSLGLPNFQNIHEKMSYYILLQIITFTLLISLTTALGFRRRDGALITINDYDRIRLPNDETENLAHQDFDPPWLIDKAVLAQIPRCYRIITSTGRCKCVVKLTDSRFPMGGIYDQRG